MGRRVDPEVEKKRLAAARLEQEEGLNAAQIGKRMGVSKNAVQKWLRKVRGPKRPVRGQDVVARLKEGKSLKEIAKEFGVTARWIREILKKMDLYHPRAYTKSTGRVPAYVEDPEQYKGAYWTLTSGFGQELNFYCKTLVNHDPRSAARTLQIAIEHFSTLLELRKSAKPMRVTRCQLVQALANRAARYRAMDAPEKALEMLSAARETSEGCLACDADLSRREAAALNDLGRLTEALAKIHRAKAFYRHNKGHDPNKNGIATCVLVECWTHIYGERHGIAIRLAESAVNAVSPDKYEDLYVMLWYALAYALFQRRDPGDLARAARLCDEHVARVDQGKASQNRARLYWFRAKLFEIQGNVPASINLLGAALDDVRELKLPAGMAAIGADFGRLSGDPEAFRAYLDDFKVWEWDEQDDEQDGDENRDWEKVHGEKVFPEWLKELRDLVERVMTVARTDLQSAIRTLRTEGKGDSFMPQIA